MPNQLARAAAAWPILTGIARDRGRIQYVELARRIGIHVRPLRYVLGVIQNYCMAEDLPPLTILAVDRSGHQGKGFIAWDPANADAGFEEVWNCHWKAENPFGVANGSSTETDLLRMLRTDSSAEVWRLVT